MKHFDFSFKVWKIRILLEVQDHSATTSIELWKLGFGAKSLLN